MRRSTGVLFAAALFTGAPVLRAASMQARPDSTPVRRIEQLAHRTWGAPDGAPAGIRVLAQTGDGYLWLGTAFGLVRFDGVRFTPFASPDHEPPPDLGVRHLLASRDGTLWIVWENGAVSHLTGGRLTSYGTRDGLPPVFQLTESSEGVLVAGTETGLARLTNGAWKDVGSELGFTGTLGRAVWFDSDDALWVETADRVVYRTAAGPRFLDPGTKLQQGAWQADFDETADGTVWMAEASGSAHTLRRVGEDAPVTEVRVGTFALVIDRRGSLWIGSRGDGLRRVVDPSGIRGRSVTRFGAEAEHFTEKDGLLSDVIWDLLEDREGSIWVASDRGLERFREGGLLPFATPGGRRSRAVFAARDGSVWIAANSLLQVTRIGPRGRDDVPTPTCWCFRMAQDSAGDIWSFGDRGVVRFDGMTPALVPLQPDSLREVEAITIDRSGTKWIAGQGVGLGRMVGNRLESVVPPGTLGRATSLTSDRDGRIWAGAGSHVVLYDHGKLRVFGAAEGLTAGQITDVHEDRAGTIWAVGSGGIHVFERGRFRGLAERQSLPGRAVFAMQEDDLGARWLATAPGLVRLEPGELERAFADSGHAMRYRTFDRLDGLPGAIAVTKYPVLARSRDGRIWIAADEGVAVIDPRALGDQDVPLHVLVESARIDGRELALVNGAALPARTSDLQIDYTATALSIADRVQFRYRLEGADTAWREVGARRQAFYTALEPGTYRFLVSANRGDGQWEDANASWSFRVLPAWYQTASFRTLLVFMIGGVGGLLVWVVQRRRHLRAQAELERRYEITMAERSRIAEDLHDTLLQGFAGVNLQLIAAELALPAKPDVAAETIVRVQRLTEESLREARQRVWEMRDAAASTSDLTTALETVARDRTANTPIEVAVSVSGSSQRLPRAVEDAAFRIGREAIVNAVRHAKASRIEIHLEHGVSAMRLEVRDDGRGVDPVDAAGARDRGHFGLGNMRNRASQMGGRCEVKPRPGGGTVVSLELPLDAASRSHAQRHRGDGYLEGGMPRTGAPS